MSADGSGGALPRSLLWQESDCGTSQDAGDAAVAPRRLGNRSHCSGWVGFPDRFDAADWFAFEMGEDDVGHVSLQADASLWVCVWSGEAQPGRCGLGSPAPFFQSSTVLSTQRGTRLVSVEPPGAHAAGQEFSSSGSYDLTVRVHKDCGSDQGWASSPDAIALEMNETCTGKIAPPRSVDRYSIPVVHESWFYVQATPYSDVRVNVSIRAPNGSRAECQDIACSLARPGSFHADAVGTWLVEVTRVEEGGVYTVTVQDCGSEMPCLENSVISGDIYN